MWKRIGVPMYVIEPRSQPISSCPPTYPRFERWTSSEPAIAYIATRYWNVLYHLQSRIDRICSNAIFLFKCYLHWHEVWSTGLIERNFFRTNFHFRRSPIEEPHFRNTFWGVKTVSRNYSAFLWQGDIFHLQILMYACCNNDRTNTTTTHHSFLIAIKNSIGIINHYPNVNYIRTGTFKNCATMWKLFVASSCCEKARFDRTLYWFTNLTLSLYLISILQSVWYYL